MASQQTGTLAKFGLAGVALGSVLSLTVTTLTTTTSNVTTSNVTTANIQTLSGAIISATDGGDVIEGRTLSGTTIQNTAGTAVIDNTGLVEATNLSGAQVRGAVLSGSNLTISGKYSPSTKRAPCFKANGVIGYMVMTSSGTALNGSTCN